MDVYGLPPQIVERVVCSISAAVKYQIPANIVLAVAEKEGGKAGQWNSNDNGSYDIGSMQINTNYLKDLASYGITAADVATTGCYPYDLAAWRLRKHIRNDGGDIWTRAANYHSRTPEYNQSYRADLIVKAGKWESWLNERFKTYDVDQRDLVAERAMTGAIATAQYKHNTTNDVEIKRTYARAPTSNYVPRGLIVSSGQ